MKKSALMFALLIATLLSTQHALAGTKYAGSATVARYYPVSGSQAYFMLNGGIMINPAGCSSGYYYSVPATHPEYAEYKKIILTAVASGKKIGVYLWDNKCEGPHSSVYSIFIDG